MGELKMEFRFGAPPHIMYEVFTDKISLSKMCLCPCEFKNEVNGEFYLYNKQIQGINLVLDKSNVCIKQKWKKIEWATYSIVEMKFVPNGSDECIVKIIQTEIPYTVDLKDLKKGWKSNIIKQIGLMVGIAWLK
jgi:activator of HSP90 ATPase